MRYLDFVLHVGTDQGQGCPIYVSSPAGRGRGTLSLPNELTCELDRGAAQAGRHFEAPEDTDGGEARPPDPRQLGEQLFGSLFAGRVRRLFDESRGVVSAQKGLGLRILIRLDPEDPSAARLAELPWELLYQTETRQFLNLSRKTPVSRDLVVPRPALPLVFPKPLRVLAVTANPESSDPLQLDRERENLHRALDTASAVQVNFLRVATAAELRHALRKAPYQVLHFMGHGHFDRAQGLGRVLFEDDSGGLDAIPADAFADELRDCDSLRLVVLNACSTASWSGAGGDPFAGLATALILTGLPAVLAMQRPISDEAAIAFSHEFYRHVAAGDPVDAAVVEGRLAIQRVERVQGSGVEWATPVLFLRGGSDAPSSTTSQTAGDVDARESTSPHAVTPTSSGSATEERKRQEAVPPSGPDRPSGRGKWVVAVAAITVLLTGLLLVRYVLPASEPASTGPTQQQEAQDGGLDSPAVAGGAPNKAPKPDIHELQKRPYLPNTFSTYIFYPSSAAGTFAIRPWRLQFQRRLAERLATFLAATDSGNASWLVALTLESVQESEQEFAEVETRCSIQGQFEIYYKGHRQGTPHQFTVYGGGNTRDAACHASLDKLADEASRELKDVYLSS